MEREEPARVVVGSEIPDHEPSAVEVHEQRSRLACLERLVQPRGQCARHLEVARTPERDLASCERRRARARFRARLFDAHRTCRFPARERDQPHDELRLVVELLPVTPHRRSEQRAQRHRRHAQQAAH